MEMKQIEKFDLTFKPTARTVKECLSDCNILGDPVWSGGQFLQCSWKQWPINYSQSQVRVQESIMMTIITTVRESDIIQ